MVAEKYDLYGRSRKERKVQYELSKLPLQDHVSQARKFLTKSWKSLKAETSKLKNSTKAAGDKVTGALHSVGIRDSRVAMQAGTITSAALVGLVLARRKSLFHCLLYPTLGGVGAWSLFYYSNSQNRANLYSKLQTLKTDYLTSKKSKK